MKKRRTARRGEREDGREAVDTEDEGREVDLRHQRGVSI
jgi:hypothetical protein